MVKNNITEGNVCTSVMYWYLSLLKKFDEFSLFHIKQELNYEDDKWARVGSRLEEGEFQINGNKLGLPIPYSHGVCIYLL
jgi:hypothetical protein